MLYKQSDTVYRHTTTGGYYFYLDKQDAYSGLPYTQACRVKEIVREPPIWFDDFKGTSAYIIENELLPLTFAEQAAIICEEY